MQEEKLTDCERKEWMQQETRIERVRLISRGNLVWQDTNVKMSFFEIQYVISLLLSFRLIHLQLDISSWKYPNFIKRDSCLLKVPMSQKYIHAYLVLLVESRVTPNLSWFCNPELFMYLINIITYSSYTIALVYAYSWIENHAFTIFLKHKPAVSNDVLCLLHC